MVGGQVESLFDEVLLAGARVAAGFGSTGRAVADESLLAPIAAAWQQAARNHGRPTIAMATFVRLMVVKQRCGWGYATLVREVGPEVVDEITRAVIGKAQGETRFIVRAVRIDSTVVEADVRYPSDAVLALHGARALAREGAASWLAGCAAQAPEWWIAHPISAKPCVDLTRSVDTFGLI